MDKHLILEKYRNSEEKLLISKLFDKIEMVNKSNKIETTDFLNEHEQNILKNVLDITQKSGKVQIENNVYAISAKGKIRLANFEKSVKKDEFVTEILNINEFKGENIDFYCDCDKIIGSVTIRKRLPGDSLKPAGRNVTKTLKKLFNENAYPIEKRDGNIVVCDDEGIIGVIGLCACERVKKDCNTENVFIIKLPSED